MDYNRKRIGEYFHKWKKTDLAKILCQGTVERLQDVPVTTYSDYPMVSEFSREMSDVTRTTPRRQGELLKEYYDRISPEIGSKLNQYMVEPFHFCMKTTGTTGENKWIPNGETFWKNFAEGAMATSVFSCSDTWGETKLRKGDKCLNLTAPIPYISGWGAWASQTDVEFIPPIEVTDNLQGMKETFLLTLKAIRKGEKIVAGGGIGSMFYMICKYFVDPEEFYQEYYHSMNFGLKRTLLWLKLVQIKLSRKQRKKITDYMPLKGIIIGGMDAQLYIDFFRNEFNLEPLHAYGSTEGGNLMRGDPDRKTDLVSNLRTSYFEFKTQEGEIKDLDELKRGGIYSLIITPFASILFRYDMEDFFQVVDFRDDGMPILAFHGRKKEVIDIYNYRATSNVFVQALYKAGLRSSNKWAVAKLFKPKEHIHFLMEKTWPHSEKEAEKIIFNSLMETCRTMPHTARTLRDYVVSSRIKDPSELIKVEYLKPGAFLRYTIKKGKMGSPIGQYKPPKIIPTEKMEIYDMLRCSS